MCATWLFRFRVLPFESPVEFDSSFNIPSEPSAGALFFSLSLGARGNACWQSKPCNNVVGLTRAQAGNGGLFFFFWLRLALGAFPFRDRGVGGKSCLGVLGAQPCSVACKKAALRFECARFCSGGGLFGRRRLTDSHRQCAFAL